jgi:endonuclease/exonuclease/phosphatase family metal-dependent hydrolase
VFNEDWQLVALHHAGWQEGPANGDATNEGISVAAIVRYLQRLGTEETAGVRGLERILENVCDSSPFLGFFDTRRSFEVSVDNLSGSSDYADIGFWNIEHFNDRVSHSRVDTVADVVNRLALDAFGLTEVESGALNHLVERLARFGDSYGFVHHDTPGRQDIAILFDRDTTRVEKLDDIYQRHQTRLDARTGAGKSAFPREPLFAKCIVQEAPEDSPLEFVMIVVHLKAFVTHPPSRARRALAAQMLAEIVEDIRERYDLPVVLGGDYNELITTDVLDPLAEGPDMFALTADDARAGGISYVGDRHRSLIDHIIVSDDVPLGNIEGDDAAIVRLDRSVADFTADVSDHVPIVMRMVYREEPVDDAGRGEDALSVEIPEGARTASLNFD